MARLSPGVRNMLLATILFSLMNVGVKLVPNIPAVEIIFFRSVISLVISASILKFNKVNVWGNNHFLLISRGVVGATALILFFITLQKIPLASAATIQYTSPIFTAILGVYIVREKVKPVQWLFFLIAFTGVLIVEGFDARVSGFYLFLGLTSGLFSGLAYNIIRKLHRSEHPLVIVFYFPLVALPISGAYSLFNWVQPQGAFEWIVLIAIGILTQFAQYFLTKSYQSEELSKVAILKYIGLIFALLYGFVIFDEHFNLLTYLGMTIVLVGVIGNVWYKEHLQSKTTR
ncbi:DMT family transporter [Fulvivirgaceae bacterium BMA12]|uniref:DMT family transporter n=1 Tax=Agaribacillus aureus TaxID=3051825 RepID=A0ABT8L1K3_9BACT|nr:DMT family transporter [Fulvivirgaceae bacterium BMA12]